MPVEQLIIYVILGVFFFVKFVADTFKKQRELQSAARGNEPATSESVPHGWEPHSETTEREAQPAPPVFVAPRRPPAAIRAATRDAAPTARAQKQARTQTAQRHASTLRNATELRRTFELMAILGPPRSLAPYDS